MLFFMNIIVNIVGIIHYLNNISISRWSQAEDIYVFDDCINLLS